MSLLRLARAATDGLDEACGEQQSRFVDTDIVVLRDCRLRQFAQHYQFWQRRNATDPPHLVHSRAPLAEDFNQRRCELKGQTFISADMMIVRARVLIAGMADHDRSGDELMRFTAHATTEAALAHVGHRVIAMLFSEGPVTRSGITAVVDHTDRFALQYRRGGHGMKDCAAMLWRPPWRVRSLRG